MGFEEKTDNCRESLISLTEDFVKFLDMLYSEGKINEEQYKNMTGVKREFLKNAK